MNILNHCKHSPPRLALKGEPWKTLAPFWGGEERHIENFRNSTGHGVCWGCSAFQKRLGGLMPSLWHTVSSVLLINCAMINKAVTSFSPLHPDNIISAGLSVMLNYTGWLVVIQWREQITIQDQGSTLATKLVALVTHPGLKAGTCWHFINPICHPPNPIIQLK